jgi:hypothetical protein
MNFRTNIISTTLLLCAAATAPAFNIWNHPEIAEKNSLFADVALAPLVFYPQFDFPVLPMELRLDYMPPISLPFSVGLFFKTPNPNFKSFGTRIAYHLDLDNPKIDLFFVYVFDFGFIRNNILVKYNDTPVTVHYYDFRAGVRYFFQSRIALAVETDFKVFGIILMLSIKIL